MYCHKVDDTIVKQITIKCGIKNCKYDILLDSIFSGLIYEKKNGVLVLVFLAQIITRVALISVII